MEAAKPIEFLSPKPEEIISKNLNLTIESDLQNKYSINILCFSSYLQIDIQLFNNTTDKYYSEKFYLNNIKDISKYFLICESISDVICSIEPSLNQSTLSEGKNQLKWIIKLNHPLCKEAIFIIPEKIKIYNTKELYDIICNLKQNIKDMNNKINNQGDIINKQQEIINNLQSDIKELKEKIIKSEKQTENYDLDDDSKNSNIVNNDNIKIREIKNWINPLKKIKFELLFRKSRDGSQSSDFHRLCDNKGPTLTLVQTEKNYKFGGYTQYSWKSQRGNSPIEDNDETFIFSLDLMKKFSKIKNTSAIYFTPSFGPCFGEGGTDFYIDHNLNIGYTVNCTFLKNFELTNGSGGEFKVKELEIYKVIFLN